ncbi:MAG TPA: carbohydrate ABC transporter permease [Candidatus Ornithomonoglobus merdipullorum]|uniref:Carbohydrate ABC transporter permease n=1 Tax=Candidatus Ornithomonoglobus merdipullorum TaxID=2840895 RepID=A0A9D1SE89_9FIRM|nr:carbohydrate ABC transporter permease [Candidatus Ornithomonoglobus merdipullorum]
MKKSKGDYAVSIVVYAFIIGFAIICLIPFLLVLSSSFTDQAALNRNGYELWPEAFSTAAYSLLFSSGTILPAYGVTIFITVVGTVLSMLVTCACAYAISCKSMYYRSTVAMIIYFTMLFNGGLVPTYLWVTKYLGLSDSIWSLILPSLVNAWNLLLMRNFFNSIPEALAESARIDGANDMTILFKIILPVSLPGIATIGLFYALAYWNEWYKALLYIHTEWKYPLQYLIMEIQKNIQFVQQNAAQAGVVTDGLIPAETTQMATAVVTIGPIILLYPFLQKYFVQGLTVGSVKG